MADVEPAPASYLARFAAERAPWMTSTEFERMISEHVRSITEPQFHGVRYGEDPVECEVYLEKPARVEGVAIGGPVGWATEPFLVPSQARLAYKIYRIVFEVPENSEVPDNKRSAVMRFDQDILANLPKSEWTLTFDFIKQWYQLYEEGKFPDD